MKELIEQSPSNTFKPLVNNENYRTKLWTLIKSKNVLVREAALNFFDSYMKHISKE